MSNSDDEFDIASSLVSKDVLSDGENDSDVESGFESEEESGFGGQDYQDEILSSDDEKDEGEGVKDVKKLKKDAKKGVSKGKNQNDKKSVKFPSLELSDDENDKTANDDLDFLTGGMNQPDAKKAKKGTFASFGLSKSVLINISKKGYKQPTPIQRKTIPLIMGKRDVVGMARTGSGKTAAFLLPLIERLKAHVAKIGVRAVILSPSRELAQQTYKQFKEFARGSDLRSLLLIGGDSLEDQFGAMMNNPDVIIATPGRFLHLKVEMQLDLKTVEYIVYDEADRLFEMGFAEQLNELLASLPVNRQSLLFSATLPKTLVDFAKAGLVNPVLVRLDSEQKISDQLEMTFISTKKNEREANLLSIIQDVIKIPLATREQLDRLAKANNEVDSSDDDADDNDGDDDKKRKRRKTNHKIKRERLPKANELPSENSTIVFVPTKHHVEYITLTLKAAGYGVAYIYGSLDQYARKRQLLNFRMGLCPLLVVTDVAARGIDIPILANVINFALPSSSKIFIHRVGRTARAGNKGWAYTILNESELPYLLDLEIFLGRKILLTSMFEKKIEILKRQFENSNSNGSSMIAFQPPKVPYSSRLVLGSSPRNEVEAMQELYETILKHNYDIKVLKDVSTKAEQLYFRTRPAASVESVKRAKELVSCGWDDQNLIYGENLELEKDLFLARLQNRRNKETVFELSKKDELVDLMNKRRRQLAPIQRRARERKELLEKERLAGFSHSMEDEILKNEANEVGFNTVVEEGELLELFEDGDKVLQDNENKVKSMNNRKIKKKTTGSYRDENFFLPHYAPVSSVQEKQLSIDVGFTNAAENATFDLVDDDKVQVHKQTARVKWDKNKGKYLKNQDDKKYIIGESGQKIPATFRSGRFDDWKNAHKVGNFRVGAPESSTSGNGVNKNSRLNGKRGAGNRFQHSQVKAPKLPQKGRDDYKQQIEKVKKAVDSGVQVKGWVKKGGARNEMKSTDQIRKQREVKEQRKAKNGRPSKRRK
ncbi:unnamed protein product [[Candida] boidinii]|uniref:ATP-dependent RNA helicase DBP10 n=1 Tax=Candida boidinii TaxID=5477 RepID=A0A9W6SX56_CANBO|nr:hypothetical protein B5S30_g3621 [[Candida] boidinii]GME68062.1 unnamed protein product [[Candida] boidinii]